MDSPPTKVRRLAARRKPAAKPVYPCIACGANVTNQQHAMQCEICLCWQHRLCGTNIPWDQYRAARRKEIVIQWTCDNCPTPEASTADASTDAVSLLSPAPGNLCSYYFLIINSISILLSIIIIFHIYLFNYLVYY